MMSPRDLFGVALRVLGVWFLYQAGYGAAFLAMRLAGVLNNSGAEVTEDKILVGLQLFAALMLLVGADRIVGLVYGPPVTAPRQPV